MTMKERIGERGLLSDDHRQVAVFKENKREYRASNKAGQQLLMYRVDGQMICAGECCDFAMGLPEREVVYFIELKGKDLKKAARQILATVKTMESRLTSYAIEGRAVLSRIPRPDLRATDVIRLERYLAKRSGTLRRECQIMHEEI